MSVTDTDGMRVRVTTSYLAAESDPDSGEYLFAYQIVIENLGDSAAQLISRHWIITDGEGEVREVRGPGVIGEQPRLGPGEGFEYQSFCPLPTPVGVMQGSFQMLRDDGASFDAEIKPFRLAVPGALN